MLGETWAKCEGNHSSLGSGELGKVLSKGRSGLEAVSENSTGESRTKQLLQLLLPRPVPPFLLLLLNNRDAPEQETRGQPPTTLSRGQLISTSFSVQECCQANYHSLKVHLSKLIHEMLLQVFC